MRNTRNYKGRFCAKKESGDEEKKTRKKKHRKKCVCSRAVLLPLLPARDTSRQTLKMLEDRRGWPRERAMLKARDGKRMCAKAKGSGRFSFFRKQQRRQPDDPLTAVGWRERLILLPRVSLVRRPDVSVFSSSYSCRPQAKRRAKRVSFSCCS
jgi:hypothetical protein